MEHEYGTSKYKYSTWYRVPGIVLIVTVTVLYNFVLVLYEINRLYNTVAVV